MIAQLLTRAPSKAALAMLGLAALAGCTGTPAPTAGLAPGLVAEINAPGAQMDRAAALDIVNQYRAVRGVSPLSGDASLDGRAQAIATQYAATGTPPAQPEGVQTMRLSAGYTSFAETFSGWRNTPRDADALALSSASRVGFAAVFDPNSAYGTHWVMLLGQ